MWTKNGASLDWILEFVLAHSFINLFKSLAIVFWFFPVQIVLTITPKFFGLIDLTISLNLDFSYLSLIFLEIPIYFWFGTSTSRFPDKDMSVVILGALPLNGSFITWTRILSVIFSF